MFKKWMGLSLMLCLVSAVSFADTLQDVMTYTYQNSLTINANRSDLKAIDETISQAKAGYRPNIQVTGGMYRSKYNNDYYYSSSERKYINPTEMSLSVVQPVFSGLSTVYSVQSATDRVRAGQAELETTEQRVLLETAIVYMNVIRDEAVLKLQQKNEKVLKEHLASYQKKFKAGVLTKTDVKQAEARLSGATADRIAAEGDLQVSKAKFFAVVGEEPKDLVDVKKVSDHLPASLDEALTKSLADHPQIKAARYATAAAESLVKAKKGSLLPSVNFVGAVGRQKEQVSIDESNYWQVGAQLTIPLFQSGKEYADVREARHLENKYRILWNKVIQDVRSETTAAWETHTAVKAQMKSIEKQIEASKIALSGVIREENVGSRTVLDVLDSEQEHLNNQVSLVKAHRDEIVSAFVLLSAIGQLNPTGLNLNVEPYDPTAYYEQVKNKWIGYDID